MVSVGGRSFRELSTILLIAAYARIHWASVTLEAMERQPAATAGGTGSWQPITPFNIGTKVNAGQLLNWL